ncbi:unnamed protein product [Dovyalis caffra]|uniref:Uncharacterized protein n=1 Tax=Dovyalis caffra TaxID=77055 RepID=A0AAV1QQR3_9ROSI|nr:unnamed protein product [Dovyalis caffra]
MSESKQDNSDRLDGLKQCKRLSPAKEQTKRREERTFHPRKKGWIPKKSSRSVERDAKS